MVRLVILFSPQVSKLPEFSVRLNLLRVIARTFHSCSFEMRVLGDPPYAKRQSRLLARLDQSTLVSQDDRLNAVPYSEFGQQARDVRLDGAFTDEE